MLKDEVALTVDLVAVSLPRHLLPRSTPSSAGDGAGEAGRGGGEDGFIGEEVAGHAGAERMRSVDLPLGVDGRAAETEPFSTQEGDAFRGVCVSPVAG